MSNFGNGSNSNGQFWYGSTTNFPGFLYKKNLGVGGRRSTKMAPGGNTTCNSATDLYNKYKPGGGGVGASSIANRRAKNRLATVCGSSNKCFPCYNTLGQYSSYTHNPNGFVPCPGTINISSGSAPGPTGPYTVTYLGNGSNGGSVPVDVSSPYIAGSNVTVLGNTFTREGYIFAGWSTNSSGTGSDYNGGDAFTINANTTLYAQWIPIISGDYTLTYNGNGGTGSEPALTTEYEGGASVTILGNSGSPPLSRSGYQFAGWNTAADGSGTNYVGGDAFTMPSQNTTLYANWIIGGVILFYNAGTGGTGTAPSSSGTYYTAFSEVDVAGNTGSFTNGSLVFAGWNTAANGSGTSYIFGSKYTMPGGNPIYTPPPFIQPGVYLYAQWINPLTTYNLTYNAGTGGTGSNIITSYSSNSTATISEQPPSFTNGSLVFYGWNTLQNPTPAIPGTSYPANSTITMNANKTLYAQWVSAPPYTLTVTYYANDGTGTIVSQINYPPNVQVPILGQGSLTRAGYAFLGWNSSSTGAGSVYAPGYTFTSKTASLYAQWAPGSTVKNCGGGTANNDFIYYNYPFAQVVASTNTITIYTTCIVGSTSSNIGSGAAPEGLISVTSKMVITSATITINTNTTYLTSANDYNYAYTITNDASGCIYWPTTPSVATISSITFPFTYIPPTSYPPANSPPGTATYSISTRGCTSGCGLTGTGSGSGAPFTSFNFFNQGVTLNYSNGTNTIFVSSPNNSLYTTNSGSTWIQTPNSLYPYSLITPRSSAALTTVTIIRSSPALEYVYPPLPNYTVEYDGNGATNVTSGAMIPAPQYMSPYTVATPSVTISGNTGGLAKTSFTFNGWNITPTSSLTPTYAVGDTYSGTASLKLYANWI